MEKIGLLFVFALIGAAASPPADATLLCEVRGAAHAAQHGDTIDGDSRYHVLRGELPTCGASNDPTYHTTQETSRDENKSRFCNKRWWC